MFIASILFPLVSICNFIFFASSSFIVALMVDFACTSVVAISFLFSLAISVSYHAMESFSGFIFASLPLSPPFRLL